MPHPQTCSKCQSEKILPRVRIRGDVASRYDLLVEVHEHPQAILFTGTHRVEVRARVCGECGYTELYAEKPQELYSVYMAARSDKD